MKTYDLLLDAGSKGPYLRPLMMLAALMLAGCGPDKITSNPVAARVNSNEITIREVNDIVAKMPGITPARASEVQPSALETLIDQQLAVERALEIKLDRSPEVASAIEGARRQILAQAYLQQMVKALPKPTKAEIRKYYDDHPELFAKRQQYELRALSFRPDGDLKTVVGDMSATGKSFDDVARLLESRDVNFTTDLAARSSDQLPFEILPKLAQTQVGRWLILESEQAGFQVVKIEAARTTPLDLATVAPRIEQYLFNQTATDFMKAELGRLRKQAKIQYVDTVVAQGTTQGTVSSARNTTTVDTLPDIGIDKPSTISKITGPLN